VQRRLGPKPERMKEKRRKHLRAKSMKEKQELRL
jgi:hypothetical protein